MLEYFCVSQVMTILCDKAKNVAIAIHLLKGRKIKGVGMESEGVISSQSFCSTRQSMEMIDDHRNDGHYQKTRKRISNWNRPLCIALSPSKTTPSRNLQCIFTI